MRIYRAFKYKENIAAYGKKKDSLLPVNPVSNCTGKKKKK
jgi:hypothetical protein